MHTPSKTKIFLPSIYFSLIFFLGLSFFNATFAGVPYIFELFNETNLTLEFNITNGNYDQHNMGTSVKFTVNQIKPPEQLKDLGTLYLPQGYCLYNTGNANANDWGASWVFFNALDKATDKIVATFIIGQDQSGDDFYLQSYSITNKQYKSFYRYTPRLKGSIMIFVISNA